MEATIIGAGIVGLATALYLEKAGFHVDVHEIRGREWFGRQGYTKGKKLFLDLSFRGLKTLRELGLISSLVPYTLSLFFDSHVSDIQAFNNQVIYTTQKKQSGHWLPPFPFFMKNEVHYEKNNHYWCGSCRLCLELFTGH